MSDRLAGKVCVVTGTGGTMGREAALTFSREGALVVGCGLYADDAEETVQLVRDARGTMVSLHPCDLTKPSDCKALVDLAVQTFGRIDVLFTLSFTGRHRQAQPTGGGWQGGEHAATLARRPTLTAPARAGLSEARVGTKKRAFRSNKETDEGEEMRRPAETP